MTKRRNFQIAEQIQMHLAQELLQVSDPRFSLVTITSVVLSSDMRHAKVYWTVSGDEKKRKIIAGAFSSAAGMFRKVIAKELSIRFVPELKFFYDDTLDVSTRIEELMSKIRREETNI